MELRLWTPTVASLFTLWLVGVFAQSVLSLTVGVCGIIFITFIYLFILKNILPDGDVLKFFAEMSPSPVPSFSSLPRPGLPTEDVVLATESRWFAILSDSRAQAKLSPTASMIGIKSC